MILTLCLKQIDEHSAQCETLSVAVGHIVLLTAEDLRDHEHVVEEENLEHSVIFYYFSKV